MSFAESSPLALTTLLPPHSTGDQIPLPLIRVHRLFMRTQIIAFYEDHLLVGTCFTHRPRLSEEHYHPEGELSLKRLIGNTRIVPYDKIKEVRETGTFKDQPRMFTASLIRNKLRIILKDGGSMNVFITATQMRHPSALLSHRLGVLYQRRVVQRRAFLQSLCTMFLAFLIMGYEIVGTLGLVNSKLPAAAAVAAFCFFAGLAGSVWAVKSKRTWQEASRVADRAPQPRKPRRASAGKQAFYSRLLGWLLKFAGLGYLLVLSLALDALAEQWSSSPSFSMLHKLIVLPGVLMIFSGYRLCQKPYRPKTDKQGLRKILFLRPFENDHTTSLQPDGWMAALAGLRPKWSKPNQLPPERCLNVWDLIVNSHPTRLIRMFFGLAVDTSEEVLARFFSRIGPVIAIGQPGELLPTPGAARMYLPDDQWQTAVEEELLNAQIVLVQPGVTDGVQWELEQIRQKCEPCRVLLCLVDYWKRPDDYENLILLIRRTMQVNLPRAVPYLDRPAFVYFDAGWGPVFQPLSYKCPIWWPLTGNAPDLDYTLQPFLQGVHGGDREPSRPALWANGFKTSVVFVSAITIAVFVIETSFYLMRTASAEINKVFFPQVTALMPESPEDQVRRLFRESPKVTLRGRSVPYLIDVPESLLQKPTSNDFQEYQLASDNNHIALTIIAIREEEDLSGLVNERIESNKGEGIDARLVTNKTTSVAGVPWNEIQLDIKGGDLHFREHTYTHSSSVGTMIIILQFVVDEDTEKEDAEAAYSILKSVRFTR